MLKKVEDYLKVSETWLIRTLKELRKTSGLDRLTLKYKRQKLSILNKLSTRFFFCKSSLKQNSSV